MRFAYIAIVILVSLFALVEKSDGQAQTPVPENQSVRNSIWDWIRKVFAFICSLNNFIDIFIPKKST
uniref:Salivary secreted peptide n=1 Tax=Trichobilharzia regenti TaxID=157069 RepID=A0AA85IX84_TRIRE|nr:unnamed protein product [Trichobilharzia regenti]